MRGLYVRTVHKLLCSPHKRELGAHDIGSTEKRGLMK
jgi:hypothetical protein